MGDIAYPLFVPPMELSTTSPKDWSAKDADRYMRWLIGVIDERTDALLRYFDEIMPGKVDEVEPILARMGTRAEAMLRTAQFSTMKESGLKLTDQGYALAADLGLLVARLLLDRAAGSVQWKVLRRPKSDIFYNHPVLVGLGAVPLEPIGGSIAEAYGVLREERSSDVWQKFFTHWLARLKPMPVDVEPDE